MTARKMRTNSPSAATSQMPWTLQTVDEFRQHLLTWFHQSARQLPWRTTTDPYRIWVSEIMLQQTQVRTVIPRYERFLERFPTVRHLASASEEEVLKMWEGLGYYRRATQMWAAARQIVQHYDGVFPISFAQLVQLPGIGRYTAGAILSIAFDQPLAILEANTERLLARLLAIDEPLSATVKNRLWKFAQTLVPPHGAGRFNQAAMELGSLVCKPQPCCSTCPVRRFCAAAELGKQTRIPVRPVKKPAQYSIDVAVVLCRNSPTSQILLRRYGAEERWAGLWDFVRFSWQDGSIPSADTIPTAKDIQHRTTDVTGIHVDSLYYVSTMRHGVTHYRITLHVFHGHVAITTKDCPREPYRWLPLADIQELPLHSTARKIARTINFGSLRPS